MKLKKTAIGVVEWLDRHAVIFAAVGLIGVGVVYIKQSSEGLKLSTFKKAQIAGCERTNILLASDNRSHERDFEVFSLTGALVSASIKTNPTLSLQQKETSEHFAGQIIADARSKEWTPLAKCHVEVDTPALYKIPASIPFYVKLPPPSALGQKPPKEKPPEEKPHKK